MPGVGERFRGRKAVVTGGASGIGWAIVERLTSEGASVAIWDRSPAADATSDTRTIIVDLTDPAAVEAAARQTITTFGSIDILVCSAGIAGLNATAWEYPL